MTTTSPTRAEPTAPSHRTVAGAVGAVVRLGLPVLVLGVLLAEVGAAPFLRALGLVTPGALAAAVAVTLATTVLTAWRWTWVARRLGLRLGLRRAVAAYYRSQLLNQVLPGGVLGDVHRAVRHGGDELALGRAARAVAWERVAGQVGLLAVTLVVVPALPSAVGTGIGRAVALTAATLAALSVVAVLLVGSVRERLRDTVVGRGGLAVRSDWEQLASGAGPWPPLAASVAAAAGYLALLLVTARAAGADLPAREMLPLLVVVLFASSLPVNLAGWGPREGAAAWVFATAGLGAATGVTVATLYGVLSLAAATPGLVVLLTDVRRPRPTPATTDSLETP
jgi:uncharacterized membrane protein YbhN (UPF0104 family)